MFRSRKLASLVALGFAFSAVAFGPSSGRAAPHVITVAGSLQSELGCPGDWQPACPSSELAPDGADALHRSVRATRRGVRVQGHGQRQWDENYGAGGVSGRSQHPDRPRRPARP